MLSFIKKYRELEYLAYHDILTDTFNRNWLIKNINSIKCLYVYFIDIDNLHKINNNGGHIAGDELIKKVANKLKVNCNIVVRYAGDEFIVFTNDINSVKSDKLYSLGFANISTSVDAAIQKADLEMIRRKKHKKLTKF